MITLQHVILPDTAIGADPGLFFRLAGPGRVSPPDALMHLGPGGRMAFDTYFNLFSYGKWHGLCALQTLELVIEGTGEVAVQLWHALPDQPATVLSRQVVALSRTPVAIRVDLADARLRSRQGVIWFDLTATGTSPDALTMIRRAAFVTADRPARDPRLALSITTFRREAVVQATAARIDQFLQDAEFGDRMHLFVVDNGDSAVLPDSPRLSRLPNPNLGGAGGFARGLMEAEAAGFSHVLFMDDDAAIHMEAIHRTYALLALARDPALAVAGAMISAADPARMWENGAIFDGKCMPLFCGTDLRDPQALVALEAASAAPAPDKFYGGWWFFAFPVDRVAHYPFPFFVRGDDVNFSLANDFTIVTLNGVVSLAEDFTAKETPLTWYLDLRSHMVHHLTLDKMEIGRIRVAKIGIWFFLRNLARFQYDTIEAVLMAWQDVMRGPEFFVEHADMTERRAQIRALTRAETWKPLADLDLSQRVHYGPVTGWQRVAFRISLNGHLLPFHTSWGNKMVIPPQERALYKDVWGSSQITYLNPARDMGYTVRQSKRQFLKLSLRLLGILALFLWQYPSLLDRYRKRYPEMTQRQFWRDTLKLGEASRTEPRKATE